MGMLRLPKDSVSPAVIDVWDVGTFTADLIKKLEGHAKLIRDYFDTEKCGGLDRYSLRPANPHSTAYHTLLRELCEFMASHTIRAFHYTRLTDDEVTDLVRSGIHLSTPESLRSRLDARVASGDLPADIANRLYDKSPFHDYKQRCSRFGRFWMVSHPIAIDDDGVAALMGHWGGEVASFRVRDTTLPAPLTTLGKARIIEVAAPLSATGHADDAGKAVVATFGRAQGAFPEKSVFDLCVKTPLPAGAVLEVHNEGDATFAAMGRTYPDGFVDVDADHCGEFTGEED